MNRLCVATQADFSDDSTAESSRTDASRGPSLFEEIDEAINMCTLTYTLTMLRRLVREGKIKHKQGEIMHLPLSLEEANELVLEQKHNLTLSKYSENKRVFTQIVKTLSDREFYLSHTVPNSPTGSPRLPRFSSPLSERSDSRLSGSRSSSSNSRSIDRPPATVKISTSFITAFGGEKTKNGLVYSISVNIERKVVTLCFRGAETDVDWAPLNTDVFMKEISNPLKRHASQPATLKIHNQLHELLIRPTLRASEADWETLSEYQEILEEFVVPTLIENPGYTVWNADCYESFDNTNVCSTYSPKSTVL